MSRSSFLDDLTRDLRAQQHGDAHATKVETLRSLYDELAKGKDTPKELVTMGQLIVTVALTIIESPVWPKTPLERYEYHRRLLDAVDVLAKAAQNE